MPKMLWKVFDFSSDGQFFYQDQRVYVYVCRYQIQIFIFSPLEHYFFSSGLKGNLYAQNAVEDCFLARMNNILFIQTKK